MATDPSEKIAKLHSNVLALNKSVLEHYGTMAALEAVVLALVEAHPDPGRLQRFLNVGPEQVHGTFLHEMKSEPALEKFQEALRRAADLCQIAIARQSAGK